jgi:predicted ATPase
MITKLRIANFKSLRQETELDLRPLTVIAGANSSGKSTVLQPLLLLAQTFVNRVGSEPIILNGPLLQLGAMSDICSFGSNLSSIKIGVDLRPLRVERQLQMLFALDFRRSDAMFEQLSVDFTFDKDTSNMPTDAEGLHPVLSKCNVIARGDEDTTEIDVIRGEPHRSGRDSAILWTGPHTPAPDVIEDARKYHVSLDPVSAEAIGEDLPAYSITGCLLRHCLPDRLLVSYNRREQIARGVTQALTRLSMVERGRPLRPAPRWREYAGFVLPARVSERLHADLGAGFPELSQHFSKRIAEGKGYSLSDWWAALGSLHVRDVEPLRTELSALAPTIYDLLLRELPAQREEETTDLPRAATSAILQLERYFSTGIRYLGPLRESPKPLYSRSASMDSTDVGLRGENTAAVLDIHRQTRIAFAPPPGTHLEGPGGIVPARLYEAVSQWLAYLGVVDSVTPRDMGKLGHELKVTTHGVERPHDLTNVGVGVSQVLPIVVMCLLAPVDSTMILEQPELHLHPAVQARLADFFLSIAKAGKQCIVETHSEYLINRLRLRSVQAMDDELSELVSVYFVEKPKEASLFRRVVINEFGAIRDWPKGFFDQSPIEAEAILRASIEKKKRSRRDERS